MHFVQGDSYLWWSHFCPFQRFPFLSFFFFFFVPRSPNGIALRLDKSMQVTDMLHFSFSKINPKKTPNKTFQDIKPWEIGACFQCVCELPWEKCCSLARLKRGIYVYTTLTKWPCSRGQHLKPSQQCKESTANSTISAQHECPPPVIWADHLWQTKQMSILFPIHVR